MVGRSGRYAGYREEKRDNELPFQSNWCIYQVRLGNSGPLPGCQGNDSGVWSGTHGRKLMPSTAPTDLHWQVVHQFGLSGFNETTHYLALCQWERANGGRSGAIQPQNQDQNMDLFVRPRHRAFGGYYSKLGWRPQPLAPPLHQYGVGRCSIDGRGLPMGASFRRWQHPPKASYLSKSHGSSQ